MLSLQMKSGDYVTINDNIVVQVFRESGPGFRVSIKAPREIPIVRGKVREREGGQRPEGLQDKRPKSPSDQLHAARQLQKLAERQELRLRMEEERSSAIDEMSHILSRMRPGAERRALEAQLQRIAENNIFEKTENEEAQAG